MEHDELDQYLNALQREDCYRVDAVLKESAFETTQRVFFVGKNGAETGPYIRKFINREADLGGAYERIYQAQQQGKRFVHLPTIVECYERGDQLAVVMEYVQGETLQDLVYRSDPSVGLARAVFGGVCDAVAELHESFMPAIIHRDLKPSNIIMNGANAVIIDFGIAREFKGSATQDTTHFGTRAFAPPEQFGYGQTTVRSDVYALGMLLYFCLTEEIPSPNVNPAGFTDPRIPATLRPVLERATAFDPSNRYANARELKAAFDAALASDTASAATQGNQPERLIGAHIRNIILLVFAAIVIPSFWGTYDNPPADTAAFGTIYVGYMAFVALPLLLIGLLWLFADKRPFVRAFPAMGALKLRHWVGLFACLFLLLTIGATIIRYFA